jgi:hypothetical protein
MWPTLGFDQTVMIGGAIVLAIAAPIGATIMVLRYSWERPRRVLGLYTLIFESAAAFSFGWGIMGLPKEFWLQRVIEFAAIGMLILAMILISRLRKYILPQPTSQSRTSEEGQ